MSASEIKNVDLRLLSNAMCERKTKKLTVVLENNRNNFTSRIEAKCVYLLLKHQKCVQLIK